MLLLDETAVQKALIGRSHSSTRSEAVSKRVLLSILGSRIKSSIVSRLALAEKAAYTDLLDSAGVDRQLGGTGTFNYQLKQLEEDGIVAKTKGIYRLTPQGRSLASFLETFDRIWSQHVEEMKMKEMKMGEMDLFDYAEDFQETTGIRMGIGEGKRVPRKLDFLMSEDRVIGIALEEWTESFMKTSRAEVLELQPQEMGVAKAPNGKIVLSHPRLSYFITPFYFGAAQGYIASRYKDSHVYASLDKPMPLIVRAKPLGERYKGCAIIIAFYDPKAKREPLRVDKEQLARLDKPIPISKVEWVRVEEDVTREDLMQHIKRFEKINKLEVPRALYPWILEYCKECGSVNPY